MEMARRLLNNSKRQTLMYVVLGVWFVFGIIGIIFESSLTDLSVYFSSLALPFLGYIWGETKRPSAKKTEEIDIFEE